MARIESFLAARLFLAPHRVGSRIYFVSNISGRLSLYAMDVNGSVPELLLPPDIALQNPELIGGDLFYVFPKLGNILVMIDKDGDENYQPMLIPLAGDFPTPAFGSQLEGYRVSAYKSDPEHNIVYLAAQSRKEAMVVTFQGNLETGSLLKLYESEWGAGPSGVSADHQQVVMTEGYTAGDAVMYHWQQGQGVRLLYGVPIGERSEGQQVPLNSLGRGFFVANNRGLLVETGLFDDRYGLGYMDLATPQVIKPVTIKGTLHTGNGEYADTEHLEGSRYRLLYNIDGCAWEYEAEFDEANLTMQVTAVICGQGLLADGVIEGIHYDKISDSFTLAFSTATSPTQIYKVSGKDRKTMQIVTRERVLGVPQEQLAPGEDASFTSFDGLRISARLYLPAPTLGYSGPRPLVYYVHGGPQSQERPNFAWFSMPLIQYLTLNGFAVFVPNVRGSSGYGLSYMKKVDRDWGGDDMRDHVYAMEQVLPKDSRLDTKRAAVVGRSYGGYMTLMLASRHPQLWSAACDMFGPYSLLSFLERIPPTWKPYFALVLGSPEKDHDFLIERSPVTKIEQMTCPMLVIQGKNDPRVVEQESRDAVERLRGIGKTVEYLMFENEGHDVLKFENRVRCYNAITEFFRQYLKP